MAAWPRSLWGRGPIVGLAVLCLGLGVMYPTLWAHPAAAQAQSAVVSVFPIVGSRLASPQTQLAFRGVSASGLGPIRVIGSRTGPHSGQIVPDSDGAGASFIPTQPFAPGETVTVTTSLNVSGASAGSYQFQVATPAGSISGGQPLRVPRARGDIWRFRSRPDLAPPAVRFTHGAGYGGGADIFLTPQWGPVQNGLEILDPRGQLIWFNRVARGTMAADLRVQRYHGQPVLTWWQGFSAAGMGIGQDLIYDSSYRQIATVSAANGLSADLHEFQITPSGTALLTAYFPVYWDASALHGLKHAIVFDSVVQEIDIPTGLVLFQWDSLDHVPLTDSYQPPPPESRKYGFRNPYDYFHINSIQLDGDGSLLVSARNTWAVYKLDHHTGSVIWRLGGKHSSFRMLGGASFAFQHDVRSHAPGDRYLTLFDDGAGLPAVHKQSRALELILDFKHRTAGVFKEWSHSPQLLALFEGNVEQLPNSDEFVGWGQIPYFTEFDQRRRIVLDARFVSNTSSYRAYRFLWSATPAQPPALVVAPAGKRMTLFVSWNGATSVAAWRVLAGASPAALQPVARIGKRTFETDINVPRAPYAAIQALDAGGRVLGAAADFGSRYGVPHVRLGANTR